MSINQRDPAADDMLQVLIQDVLPHIRMDELLSSCIGTMKVLMRMQASLAKLSPSAVWEEVRMQAPQAASFPLGGAAERATRRLVLSARRSGRITREELVHQFLAFMVFETALMDMRGNSDDLRQDYGFWYHWHTDGRFRSLEDEAETRQRLWHASIRAATESLRAWIAGNASGCVEDEDFDNAIREVFKLGPAPRRRLKRTITVVGLEAKAPLGTHPMIDRGALRIVVGGPGATALLDDKELLALCGGTLDSRIRDLLDIATVFFFADICVPRSALFARDLAFLMPVRNPDLWTKNADALARIGAFLTGNDVAFRFTAHPESGGVSPKFRVADDDRCVALFSGGLDSFVGAAHALKERRAPLFVSHSASTTLTGIQRRLLTELRSSGKFDSVNVRTTTKKGLPVMEALRTPQTELYQHGRSFLFLSLATAVALSKGIANIRVYENGPVALNVVFSEARFNTRTTHPVFFAMFRKLIQTVFEVDIRLENPFALLTKGEVVTLLPEEQHSGIRLTNSCWGYSKVQLLAKRAHASGFGGKHCGRCVPCVWRRAAVGRANLSKFDDRYLWDAVPDKWWSKFLDRRHLTVLLDLYRACQNSVAAQTDNELLDVAPDLDEIGPGTQSERLAMHRRYSQEIVEAFDQMAGRLMYRPADDQSGKRAAQRS